MHDASRVTRPLPRVVAVAVLATLVAGCAAADDERAPTTIAVPADAATIAEAADAAVPGDLILVAPGVYPETVELDTPGVTLRGEERDGVVIDGEVRRANGVVVTADGVTVQNLTVRSATQNGILVTGMTDERGAAVGGHDGYEPIDEDALEPLQGFRVDHVTASGNGLYGIYAFTSTGGVIEHSYASGSADSGIYVGQCVDCDIVVRANVAEHNAVGFEVANAGGSLLVVGNRLVGNRVGATIGSDYQEAFLPQADVTLAGNLVAANAVAATPEQADGGWGIGVGIAGGTQNAVVANRIVGHPGAGIVLTSNEDLGPIDNRIERNVLADNAVDAVYAPTDRGPGSGTCLADNELAATQPIDLVATAACDGPGTPTPVPLQLPRGPAGIPFTEVAPPPPLPSIDDVESAATIWTPDDVPDVAVDDVAVPDASLLAEQSLEQL